MTDKATGGPVNPERTYWIGEHGPEPQYDPEFIQWIRERGFELWARDANRGFVRIEPPPEPPKLAWWEYRWPPLAMAIAATVIGIITIINALGD